jgi:putative ribosome biogenesis GTPase RsgA
MAEQSELARTTSAEATRVVFVMSKMLAGLSSALLHRYILYRALDESGLNRACGANRSTTNKKAAAVKFPSTPMARTTS